MKNLWQTSLLTYSRVFEIRNVECVVCQRSGGSVFDIIQFNSDNTIGYNYKNKRVMYGVLR
jgi:hypothetical protein